MGEIIKSVIGNGEKYGIDVSYSYEDKPMGTVGALSLIKDRLQKEFVVMNGDILHNVIFEKLFKEHKTQSQSKVTITAFEHTYKVPLGVLELKNNNVNDYIEKPTSNYMVSMGIYVLDRLVVDQYLKIGEPLDFPDLIRYIIKNKEQIHPFFHEGLWVDLGTTEDYIKVLDELPGIKNKYPEIPLKI